MVTSLDMPEGERQCPDMMTESDNATPSATTDSNNPTLSATTEVQPQSPTFPFLSLPPEVRNRIYEWALCPTGVLIQVRSRYSRLATRPILTPQLLSSCRKVYAECGRNRSFLFENEVCISIDAHDTSWPVISEARLPQHVLERIERLCIVFDCTGQFRASYTDVDFDALTALTSLKQLRFAVIFDPAYDRAVAYCKDLLEQVLKRLPTDIKIAYGINEEEIDQHAFLKELIERKQRERRGLGEAKCVDTLNLESAVASVEDSDRGTLNGSIRDVFAEYRAERSGTASRLGRSSYFAM